MFILPGTFTLQFKSMNPNEEIIAPLSKANSKCTLVWQKTVSRSAVFSHKVTVAFLWDNRCFCRCSSAAGLGVLLRQALKNSGLGCCISKLEMATAIASNDPWNVYLCYCM